MKDFTKVRLLTQALENILANGPMFDIHPGLLKAFAQGEACLELVKENTDEEAD